MFNLTRKRTVKVPVELVDEMLELLLDAKNVLHLHDGGDKSSATGRTRVRIESFMRKITVAAR